MSYYPNAHGVKWLLDSVWPQISERAPGARLFIVGARPPRWLLARASANVIVTGYVDDVRPYSLARMCRRAVCTSAAERA